MKLHSLYKKIYREIQYRAFSVVVCSLFIVISFIILSFLNFLIFFLTLCIFVGAVVILRLMLYKMLHIKKYSILNLIFVLVLLFITVIFLFAMIYHYFNDSESNYLMFLINGVHVKDFFDAIYFSSVTFFAVGYGDIIPHGMLKVTAIMEVMLMVIMNIVFIGVIANFIVQHRMQEESLRIKEMQKEIEQEISIIKEDL